MTLDASMARVDALQREICPTCRMDDGSINTEWAYGAGSCVYGCGRRIDHEEGMGCCPYCGDHSANEAECETCGQQYADWDNGTWEVMK